MLRLRLCFGFYRNSKRRHNEGIIALMPLKLPKVLIGAVMHACHWAEEGVLCTPDVWIYKTVSLHEIGTTLRPFYIYPDQSAFLQWYQF